jgi:predicted dehydrogenase
MQDVGVGFIGAGDIASIHKVALLKIPGVKLTAVYDTDRTRSEALAHETGARRCLSAEQVVTLPDVDVVYILTPQQQHYKAAVLALTAGKNTFIEKPVSLSVTEITDMITLSKQHSCLCVPGHNYIHARELQMAKELIRSGQLGEIRSFWILFMVSLPPEIRNRIPGPLREVMIHQFYSTLFLLGKPVSVSATISDFSSRGEHNEDQVSIVGKFADGSLMNLFASFAAEDLTYDPWTLKYKIIGSLGSASHTWSLSRLSSRPQPVWDLPAYWETFREEDRYFIEDCIRGGKQPLSNMEDALACLEILNAAERSVASGSIERVG